MAPRFESLFAAQDDQFVHALRESANMPELAKFVETWVTDGRAWAHDQILRYLDLPWDCHGHQPVIKRLFKWAEAAGNDEVMAAFATGCDRLVRRERKQRWKYDWKTRSSWQETVLISPRDSLTAGVAHRDYLNPRTGERIPGRPLPQPSLGKLFSYHTRYYLRRRAWRYFRWMAFQRPQDYPLAVARALILYRDEDLQQGENLLDSWTFMHVCFGEHDALEFASSTVRIVPGRSLGELVPAPRFLPLWQENASFDVLMLLVQAARSRPVRVWAVEMLHAHHEDRLKQLSADALLELLKSDREDVQQFAVELLEQAPGTDAWPLSTWLELLETENLTILETICRVMETKVSGDRLNLAETIRLAIAEPSPVANLGFRILKKRTIETPEDIRRLADLSSAECQAIAGEMASWALPILGRSDDPPTTGTLAFFDSLSLVIRKAAWEWLLNPEESSNESAYGDALFWCRLLETPFDDVRQKLIETLQKRSQRTFPRPDADQFAPVWCSVLAGVHRGSRQKPQAISQITSALQKAPDRAKDLIPVLAIAVRSIRPAEMRPALAALAELNESHPDIARQIAETIPELQVIPIGETVW